MTLAAEQSRGKKCRVPCDRRRAHEGVNQMGRKRTQKLVLRSETLKRIASGELAGVAGGLLGRCTWEASNCGTATDACVDTYFCETGDCPTMVCGE